MAVLRSPTPPLANGGAIPSAIMYFVYILRCKDKKLYIGYSDDLLSRFKEHESGMVDSTKHRRPLTLFYYEAYSNKKLAQERERKLKQFGSSYKGLVKRLGIEQAGLV